MAFFCSLCSGSSGNCTLVGCGGAAVLIDAGMSARGIKAALLELGLGPGQIAALFITHEHSDHIRGLPMLASRWGLPVYASPGTIEGILSTYPELPRENLQALPAGRTVEIAGMSVCAFKTPHDSLESTGYRLHTPDGRGLAVCTDLGYVTGEVMQNLTGCDAVVLESNHDVSMLKSGRYPYFLKKRILSDHGHLSNDGCAAVLPELVQSGTKRIMLAHLSADNNRPELAEQVSVEALAAAGLERGRDYQLEAAPRHTHGTFCRL